MKLSISENSMTFEILKIGGLDSKTGWVSGGGTGKISGWICTGM